MSPTSSPSNVDRWAHIPSFQPNSNPASDPAAGYSGGFDPEQWRRFGDRLEELDSSQAAAHHFPSSSTLVGIPSSPEHKQEELDFYVPEHRSNAVITNPSAEVIDLTSPTPSPSRSPSPFYGPISPQHRPCGSPTYHPTSPQYSPPPPSEKELARQEYRSSPGYYPTSPQFSPPPPSEKQLARQEYRSSPGYYPTSPQFSPPPPSKKELAQQDYRSSPKYYPTSPQFSPPPPSQKKSPQRFAGNTPIPTSPVYSPSPLFVPESPSRRLRSTPIPVSLRNTPSRDGIDSLLGSPIRDWTLTVHNCLPLCQQGTNLAPQLPALDQAQTSTLHPQRRQPSPYYRPTSPPVKMEVEPFEPISQEQMKRSASPTDPDCDVPIQSIETDDVPGELEIDEDDYTLDRSDLLEAMKANWKADPMEAIPHKCRPPVGEFLTFDWETLNALFQYSDLTKGTPLEARDRLSQVVHARYRATTGRAPAGFDNISRIQIADIEEATRQIMEVRRRKEKEDQEAIRAKEALHPLYKVDSSNHVAFLKGQQTYKQNLKAKYGTKAAAKPVLDEDELERLRKLRAEEAEIAAANAILEDAFDSRHGLGKYAKRAEEHRRRLQEEEEEEAKAARPMAPLIPDGPSKRKARDDDEDDDDDEADVEDTASKHSRKRARREPAEDDEGSLYFRAPTPWLVEDGRQNWHKDLSPGTLSREWPGHRGYVPAAAIEAVPYYGVDHEFTRNPFDEVITTRHTRSDLLELIGAMRGYYEQLVLKNDISR